MSEGFYRAPEAFHFEDLDQSYRGELPADKSTPILDIGCGHGRMLAFLSRHGYTDLRGVDRDEEVVSWAAANVTPNVEVVSDTRTHHCDTENTDAPRRPSIRATAQRVARAAVPSTPSGGWRIRRGTGPRRRRANSSGSTFPNVILHLTQGYLG